MTANVAAFRTDIRDYQALVTNGQLGVLLGGTYLVGNGVELTGGARYALLGDATTNIGAEFDGSDSLSLALRVGYRF